TTAAPPPRSPDRYLSDLSSIAPPAAPPSTASSASRSSDRKSTRLNSSHGSISYAVFCLKKKFEALKKLAGAVSRAVVDDDKPEGLRGLAKACEARPGESELVVEPHHESDPLPHSSADRR